MIPEDFVWKMDTSSLQYQCYHCKEIFGIDNITFAFYPESGISANWYCSNCLASFPRKNSSAITYEITSITPDSGVHIKVED